MCQVGFDETTQKVTLVRPRERFGDDSGTAAKKRRRFAKPITDSRITDTTPSFQHDGVQMRADTVQSAQRASQTSQLNHSMVSSCGMVCGSP